MKPAEGARSAAARTASSASDGTGRASSYARIIRRLRSTRPELHGLPASAEGGIGIVVEGPARTLQVDSEGGGDEARSVRDQVGGVRPAS